MTYQVLVYQLCFNFSLAFNNNSNKWTGKASAPSNWRQKKARQRRADPFLFNLFLCAIFHKLYSA